MVVENDNDLRNSERVSFPYMAKILFNNRQDTVRLIDLSMQGIKVKNTLGLSLEDKIRIVPILPKSMDIATFELDGVVVRSEGADMCVGVKVEPNGLSGLISLSKTIVGERKATQTP